MSETFSRSLQKRIEAQAGEKLFTKRDLDLAVLEVRIAEVVDWRPHDSQCASLVIYSDRFGICNCGRDARLADLQKQKAELAASISENNP